MLVDIGIVTVEPVKDCKKRIVPHFEYDKILLEIPVWSIIPCGAINYFLLHCIRWELLKIILNQKGKVRSKFNCKL